MTATAASATAEVNRAPAAAAVARAPRAPNANDGTRWLLLVDCCCCCCRSQRSCWEFFAVVGVVGVSNDDESCGKQEEILPFPVPESGDDDGDCRGCWCCDRRHFCLLRWWWTASLSTLGDLTFGCVILNECCRWWWNCFFPPTEIVSIRSNKVECKTLILAQNERVFEVVSEWVSATFTLLH